MVNSGSFAAQVRHVNAAHIQHIPSGQTRRYRNGQIPGERLLARRARHQHKTSER